MENKGIYQCYKRNRKIPIAKKLEYIELAKIKGNNAVAKIVGVSSKTIRKWRKIEINWKQVSNPETKITLHKMNMMKIIIYL